MDIYEKRRHYSVVCKNLKKTLFEKVFSDTATEYDSNDELSVEIFEPMFDSIIAASIAQNDKYSLKNDIKAILDYYGFYTVERFKKMYEIIMDVINLLKESYTDARNEQYMSCNTELKIANTRKLETELEEYLRLGEEE